MEASGDDANDDALGVVSRYALPPFFARVRERERKREECALHFLNNFPVFSLSRFQNPIRKCRRVRALYSLFSVANRRRFLTASVVIIITIILLPDIQSPSGRPTDQRNVKTTPDDHQIRLEDDVVSFSSRDKTHTIWTYRFATTPKKFCDKEQQHKWRRRRK